MKYVDPNGQIHEKAWDFLSAMARIKFESLIGENNVIAMNETQQVIEHPIPCPTIGNGDNPVLTHIEIDNENNQLIAFDQHGNQMGHAAISHDIRQLADSITHTLVVSEANTLKGLDLTIDTTGQHLNELAEPKKESQVNDNPISCG